MTRFLAALGSSCFAALIAVAIVAPSPAAAQDVVAPAPVITDLATVVGLAGDEVTIDFGEAVTGFTLSDLGLTNLNASNLQTGDDIVFTFDVAASSDGVGRVSLPAGVVQDLSGNSNDAAANVTTTAVASRPEITFLSASDGCCGLRVYQFNATAPGGGRVMLARGYYAISITNGTITDMNLSNITGTFQIIVRPTGGDVSIGFDQGFVADDASGNLSSAFAPIYIETFDVTPPSPTITYDGYDRLAPFTATITFDEDVTGFEVGDLVVSSATLSAFTAVSASVYTVTVQGFDLLTPPEVSVPANVAQDAAGNLNVAAAAPALPAPDGVAPVVAITGVPDGFTTAQTATITFDWGEDVIDFRDTDITVTGGTLGPISGGQQTWTALLTIAGDTDVVIDVADGAVLDSSGTPSAAASVTGAFASAEIAEEIIREFLATRATSLIAAQPGLTGLLDNAGPSGTIQVSRGVGTVALHTGSEGPIWAALNANWSNIDGFETAYSNLSFGSHMYLQDETLLGVMVQFDHAASTEGLAEIEGTGWLIGPYYVARYGSVDVDARLLWGRTENEITPIGTYRDSFATERVLAMVNLSGEIEAGSTTLRPLLGWAYVDDRSDGYIDALSNPVAAQRVRLHQLEVALDWTLPVGTSGVDFVGGAAGLFTSEDGGNGSVEGGRGRFDLGLRRQGPGPLTFEVGLYADGLGQQEFEAYGLDIALDWRF